MHLFRQTCLGEIHVQVCTNGNVADNGIRPCAALGTEFLNDAFDFLCLLQFQQANVVVGIDHSNGFDENGLTGGGGVVHQTGNLAAVFRTNRQYEPSVTERDTVVLQTVLHLLPPHHAVQCIPQLLAGTSDLPANFRQSRTGCIGNFFLGENGTIQLFQQKGHRCQLAEQVVQCGFHTGTAVVPVTQRLHLPQDRGDFQQIFQRKLGTGLCPPQSHSHILKPVERRGTELYGQLKSIVCLFQFRTGFRKVGIRGNGKNFFPCDVVGGEIRQHV